MGNTENYTGYISESVKKQINDIYNLGINTIIKGISKISIDYFGELRYIWCSNKAVAFYNNHANQLVEAINAAAKDIITICQKIEYAHNILANTNGAEIISIETQPYSLLSLPQMYDNFNGVVGMNIQSVEEQTKTYETLMKLALNRLDDLPINIDFLDPGHNQLIAYSNMIQSLKAKIENEFNAIINDIKEAEQTEKLEISLSKEKAEEILNTESVNN